ncbi:ComEA family DNA-binding protein [Cycloclasticus sp. P1]|uniref:ComEA family DNA-binding protein n=1 Tax=Cycloclasticus sp. (strain P1) TaxID=385025 RepID=UPI000286A9CB|nr:ComEA family DNA-binding protein [Cycloclasticus sp. P1]AFT66732.1 DNA transport competence protein [Cycloclasticus sp. P1]
MKKVIIVLVSLSCFCFSFMALAVNINTADADDIAKELKGVGPAKAEAIVNYREKNGAFKSLKELTKIKGIGASTVDKNRENIQLDVM